MENRKYLAFALFAAFVLLSGCIKYEYTHTVEENGESTLKLSIDYTEYISMYAEGEGTAFSVLLEEFEIEKNKQCIELMNGTSGIKCTVDGAVVEFTKELTPGEYYEFAKTDSVPDHIYSLKINKIPNLNLLMDFTDEYYELDGNLSTEEEVMLLSAEEMELELYYTVIMPGEIFEAYSGEVEGKIEGNKATFNLVEVGKNSEPIIVTSRQVDDVYIYIVYLAMIFVLVWIMYTIFGPVKKTAKK